MDDDRAPCRLPTIAQVLASGLLGLLGNGFGCRVREEAARANYHICDSAFPVQIGIKVS
jgi:hypothetical protein